MQKGVADYEIRKGSGIVMGSIGNADLHHWVTGRISYCQTFPKEVSTTTNYWSGGGSSTDGTSCQLLGSYW